MIKTDFLVIGSGIAGLTFAIESAKRGQVIIITKSELSESNTKLAQGGIAAVLDDEDSIESHIQDTYQAGVRLNHLPVIREVVSCAADRIRDLIDMGVHFTTIDGKLPNLHNLNLGKEGAHSHRRIVHADDWTGVEVERALIKKVKEHPNIKIYEYFMAVDLITQHHIKGLDAYRTGITCWGAYVFDMKKRRVNRFLAKKTVLATGGCSQVYLHTTNSKIATGDGVAIAFRASARVANMEFIQFHPTTFYNPEGESFLISEAVRGEGAYLRLQNGERFMTRYHKLAELAPRDIVSQSINYEMIKNGNSYVYLDLTHLDSEKMKKRFPNIFQQCYEHDIDFCKDMIPVVPAAHYSCGGILAGIDGKTDIKNLYAIGETACIGLHGANRLASNSLLEGLVTAYNCANLPENNDDVDFPAIPQWSEENVFDEHEWIIISHNKNALKEMMWNYVGIVRSNRRLEFARQWIKVFYKEVEEFYHRNPIRQDLIETRNLITIAYLIVRSAISRKESRGLHYNSDYPKTLKKFEKDTIIK